MPSGDESENDLNTEEHLRTMPIDKFQTNNSLGKKKNNQAAIYISPSTGRTWQTLQNASTSTDIPSASTSNLCKQRIKISEDIVIKPSKAAIDAFFPESSDDEYDIFSTPKNLKKTKFASNSNQISRKEIAQNTRVFSGKEPYFISTPKSGKKSILNNAKSLNRKEEPSSALTSRCNSFSDIPTSDLVSLNSSFNDDQILGLMSSPLHKENLQSKVKKILPPTIKEISSQPSTSGIHENIKSNSYSQQLTDVIEMETEDYVPQPYTSSTNKEKDIAINSTDIQQSRVLQSAQAAETLCDTSSSEEDYVASSDSDTSDSSSRYSSDDLSEQNGETTAVPSNITINENEEWQDILDTPLTFEEFEGNVEINAPLNLVDPEDYYKLFVTDEIIDKMVLQTNKYAVMSIESDKPSNKSRSMLWKPTDKEEMHKFLAVLLAMGLVKMPHLNDYWSKKKLYRNEYIASLMSRDRFLLMLKYWHFSDNSNAGTDKLYKIREIHDLLLTQFRKIVTPSKVLVIDETMIPWRGRLGFRQYIKNKSHKYGVKLYKACTPEGYTFNLLVYTGKGDGGREVNHAHNVVMKLIEGLENQGRIVVVDNFYTSIGLSEVLIEKKTFICGTLRSNRKGLPKCVISSKLKKGQITGKANSKGVRVIKWHDKRAVLMLSTCKNHDATVKPTGKKHRGTNADILKPECILTYNKYKKGIDYSDQMASYYTTLKRGVKWYRKVMMELLFGTALINAWIVYNHQQGPKMTKKQFTEHIIESFSKMSLNGHSTTNPALATGHCLKMGTKKRNCSGCYDKLRQTLSSRDAANRVKKVKTLCEFCKKSLCRDCYNVTHTSDIKT
jgi:hypothetical protein